MALQKLAAFAAIIASRALFPQQAAPIKYEPILDLPRPSFQPNITIMDQSSSTDQVDPLTGSAPDLAIFTTLALLSGLLGFLLLVSVAASLRMISVLFHQRGEILGLTQALELSSKSATDFKNLWHSVEHQLVMSEQAISRTRRHCELEIREAKSAYIDQYLAYLKTQDHDEERRSLHREVQELKQKLGHTSRRHEILTRTIDGVKASMQQELKDQAIAAQLELEDQVTEAQRDERKAAVRVLTRAGVFPVGQEASYIATGDICPPNLAPPASRPAKTAPVKRVGLGRPKGSQAAALTSSEFKALSQRVSAQLPTAAPKPDFSHLAVPAPTPVTAASSPSSTVCYFKPGVVCTWALKGRCKGDPNEYDVGGNFTGTAGESRWDDVGTQPNSPMVNLCYRCCAAYTAKKLEKPGRAS